MVAIKFGILTVSDSSSVEPSKDKSGPILEELIRKEWPNGTTIHFKDIVPDNKATIEKKLIEWSTNDACNVILTTGGTGLAPSDVTPEATKAVIDKEAFGLTMGILVKSLSITDLAMLSRAVCGIKNKTLIINFPGSSKAVQECFTFVKKIIPHAVSLLEDDKISVKTVHEDLQQTVVSKMQCQSKVTLTKPAMRDRQSPYPMLEVSEALACILKKVPRTKKIVSCDFEESLHRILAEDVHASDPLPPFDASIKDGYAVKAAYGSGVRTVRGVTAAGDEPLNGPLKDAEAIRICTGAPIPQGADAVVQVEDTKLVECDDRGEELKIEITVIPVVKQDIRDKGSDIEVCDKVLDKFDRITSAHIGVMATVGKTKVDIFASPKVAVISTGSELQNPQESALKPGHIRDSNKSTILALLKQYNYAGFDYGIVKDDPSALKKTLIDAFKECDVVITTGGVSMGEFDIVKKVLLEDFEATIHFGRVNIKPGKPTTFATLTFNGATKVVFGLPGNPVSCTVTFLIFVVPTLRHMECSKDVNHAKVKVILQEDVKLDPVRPEYVRANISWSDNTHKFYAQPTGNQISSKLTSLVNATGLLILPSRQAYGKEFCFKGYSVDAILLNANILNA